MASNAGQASTSYSYSSGHSVCQNTLYNCSQACLEGFNYCLDHITEDRNAPYRPCTFVYSNNKRCATNVLKGERRDGYRYTAVFLFLIISDYLLLGCVKIMPKDQQYVR